MIIGYRKLEFFFLEAILFYKKDLIIDDLERLLIDEYIWKKIRPWNSSWGGPILGLEIVRRLSSA